MYASHVLPCVMFACNGKKDKEERQRARAPKTMAEKRSLKPPHPYNTMACLCNALVHPPHVLTARSSYPSQAVPSSRRSLYIYASYPRNSQCLWSSSRLTRPPPSPPVLLSWRQAAKDLAAQDMSRPFRKWPSPERWDPKRDRPAPKAQEQQEEQEEQKQHQGREAAASLAYLPASSGGGGGGGGGGGEYPFGYYRSASDSSSSSSSSSSGRSEPTNQQDQEQQEQQEQQERRTLALLASPRGTGDTIPSIFHAAENKEEGVEGHASSSSSMSSLSSSSLVNSLTALPDEVVVVEEEEDEDEKEELAALQEAIKQSLEDDLDHHLAEVQAERDAATKALKEERRQQLLKIKELEEKGDTDMLSSLFRGIRYLYTLLSDLICLLTEDLFHVCLPALLSFCLSLFRLLKRGAWREVVPLVETKLHRLSSHLLVLPSDLTHLLSKFPFLPFTALTGMGLFLGCGVWYWRLKVEMGYAYGEEATAAAAAAAAEAAARSLKVEDVGGGLDDALVDMITYMKRLVSG